MEIARDTNVVNSHTHYLLRFILRLVYTSVRHLSSRWNWRKTAGSRWIIILCKQVSKFIKHCCSCGAKYTVSQKRPPFYFSNNFFQKLTDFNDFWCVNPEKIWHQQLVHLPTSPVYCSHFTLGNVKSHFQQYYSYIVQIIYVISEENKLLLRYHHTWKMSPHYLVKCTNFSSF